jgi:hypothetical protein
MRSTTPGKYPGQVILRGEGAFLFILLFGGLKHLIIERARFPQALHEQRMLLLIHEKAILERFHVSSYSGLESVCQLFLPPAGGRQFIPTAEARGPLAAFW